MVRYVDCVFAQRHLEAFVDRELSVTDEVLVESHLRWCAVCAGRVEDLQLVGVGVRAHARRGGEAREPELAAVQAAVLAQADAERRRSFGARLTELVRGGIDRRLLWPAAGATAALGLSVGLATAMWEATVVLQPSSLASMIESLADPGSDRNPMRLDGAFIQVPRVLNDRGSVAHAVLDSDAGDDEVVALAAVVTREGRIGTYELLQTGTPPSRGWRYAQGDEGVADLLDAVRRTRFAPAQAPGGRTVAVNMVWLFAATTVRATGMPADLGVPLAAPVVIPVVPVPPVREPRVIDDVPMPAAGDTHGAVERLSAARLSATA